jgi:hypothetical protein
LAKFPVAVLDHLLCGHTVLLHTYNEIDDLPEGVQCVDANEIIPQDKIFKHNKTGSYALFSDIFRYELLKKVNGVYVDCDVYCLKPLYIQNRDYLLGYEDDNKINGAVLALPKESELLSKLLNVAYDPFFIPLWYSKSKQRKLKLKKYLESVVIFLICLGNYWSRCNYLFFE